MKQLIPSALMLLGVAIVMMACGDDTTRPPIVDCFSCKCNPRLCQQFEDLSQKSDVLNNFEVAHNKRDTSHYDALLDENFTFFYDESSGGAPIPVQWGRETDIPATHGLFAGADKIDMTIDWHDGVTWAHVPSGAETWYATTVFYHFTIKIGVTTYIPNAGAKMLFTVRNAGTADAPHWQLVELRDLGGPTVFNTDRPMSAASTEATTYGTVKALYR